MEAKQLEPISDVTRLKVGDIMVVPSEAGSRRKMLHLSASSYGRLGVSMGHTCRSANRPDMVERVMKDEGRTRVYYIYNVHEVHYYSEGELMTGNTVKFVRPLPKIWRASFAELPVFDDKYPLKPTHDMLHAFAENIGKEREAIAYFGLLDSVLMATTSPVYRQKEHPEAYNDECIRTVHATVEMTDIDDLVPNMRHDDVKADGVLNTYRSKRFFEQGMFGDVGSASRCDRVLAEVKFFEAMSKRGARFYRPSMDLMNELLHKAAAPFFKEYIEVYGKVLASVPKFMDWLKRDVENVRNRRKLAQRVLGKTKPAGDVHKTIEKEMKEIL